jgi:TPR repeat protein
MSLGTDYDNTEAEAIFQQARQLQRSSPPPDLKAVEALYRQAIEKGSTKARVNLADLLYRRGKYLDYSREDIAEQYLSLNQEAADLGQPAGYLNLSVVYFRGYTGTPTKKLFSNSKEYKYLIPMDDKKGYEYLTKAAGMDYPLAQARLGKILLEDNRTEAGLKWLHKALDNGYGDAAEDLARTYAIRFKKYEQAIDLLKQGAKLGSVEVLSSLESVYKDFYETYGQKQNKPLARCYWRLYKEAKAKWDNIQNSPGITFSDLDERCSSDT